MEQSPDITELASALATFQSEMAPVGKTANNPFFKSKYADLATVMKDAMPLTSKNGLALVQFPGMSNDTEVLYTQVTHKSGQWMRSCMKLHLGKQDAQGQGSALTYAKRYAAMAALGIVADEDDDGNGASNKQTPPAKKAPAKPSEPLADEEDLNAIRKAAFEKFDIMTDEEISEVLGWPLSKLPKSKVLGAVEKIRTFNT